MFLKVLVLRTQYPSFTLNLYDPRKSKENIIIYCNLTKDLLGFEKGIK